MSVITNNTIQPASGQALTIKDEGGTASITVATNGEATFAENIILTANKGLSFQNHSVSSATGASSTTSDNVLDDYEIGTFNPSSGSGVAVGSSNGSYTKVGDLVFLNFRIVFGTESSGSQARLSLPFSARAEAGLASNAHLASLSYSYTTYTATDLHAGVQSNTSYIDFFNGGSGSITYSSLSGKQINGSIVYQAA